MATTRRDFLKACSIGTLGAIAYHGLPFRKRDASSGGETPILVVVQLSGGNDGLNTVVPYRNPSYEKHRSTLRLPARELLKIDQEVALHPSLEPFMKLLEDERLSIVQGVGYPEQSRSHFRSMAIWHHALLNAEDHTGIGWIGRALDQKKAKPGSDSPAFYVGGGTVPPAIRGARAAASSIDRIEDFMLPGGMNPRDILPTERAETASSLHAYIAQSMHSACRTADRVKTVVKSDQQNASYPGYALARKLRLVSQLIKIQHSAKVYYTDQIGYDTHAGQRSTHADLLRALSRSLSAFMNDLKASKLDDRVTVLVFSEFGRTLSENASGGTDHGTAAPVFLLGRDLRSPLLGKAPNLQDLKGGEPKPSTDFRRVYAALSKRCLNSDPSQLLPGFDPLPI